MMANAHMAVGITSSLLVAKTLNVEFDIISVNQMVALGALGGLLPDIDHANSTLGQKIPILPSLLTHRGITHTVYFVAACAFLFSLLKLPVWMLLCFSVAIFSHILGDMLTPKGIKPFKIFRFFEYNFCIPVLKIPLAEKIIEIACYWMAMNLISFGI